MNRLTACRYGSEAGIALPMTLMLMGLLTAVTVAFLAFTSSEPIIATNHMANAQARALAESGVERALWALTKGQSSPGSSGAIANPLPNPVPAPYDGSQFVNLGVGQFKVTVTNGPGAEERTIEAVGYVPTAASAIATKKIRTVVTHIPVLSPPCAVCAGGEAPTGAVTEIRVGGSASITASTAEGAQHCSDFTPLSAAYSQGTVLTNGSPDLTGPSGGSAVLTNQTQFTGSILDNDMISLLKSLAKANGTYYQGNQTWTSPPPNGIVFVDTPSGNPLTSSSPSSDLVTVDVHGNWSQSWNGWLVVAGSIDLSGNILMNGLIYAQNDVSMHGSGNGNISGAVISTNRIDTQSTNVDTEDVGNTPITYNCEAVRDGGDTIPQNWFVKPGTYREISGTS